jgi:hypothetical protein
MRYRVLKGQVPPSAVIVRRLSLEESRQSATAIRAFERDLRYLSKNKAALISSYPDEWVAVLNEVVVAHAPRHVDLVKQLRDGGFDAGSAAVKRLTVIPVSRYY